MKRSLLVIAFVLAMATASMAGAALTEAQLLEQIKGQWYAYGVMYTLDLNNSLYQIGNDKYPTTIEGYDLPGYRVAIAVTIQGKVKHYVMELRQRDNFAGTGMLIQRTKGNRGGQKMDYVGALK